MSAADDDFDDIFDDVGADQPDTDTADTAPAAAAAARAAEQEKRVAGWVREYMDRLPTIEAARPLPAQALESSDQVTGAEWIARGALACLSPVPAGYTVDARYATDGSFVTVTVTVPPGVNRESAGPKLAARVQNRGNLGAFRVRLGADPQTLFLIRDGIGGPGVAWRGHGQKVAAFYADREAQKKVFELAKLLQRRKSDPTQKRFPRVHAWGEDERGGTAELRLPPGMLLGQVTAAEAALQQALNAPELRVGKRGVYPVLHLNTKAVCREFPKVNPLRPTLFVRPRTQAERHLAAKDFVLPLGVREDGSPILIRQGVTPHMGIFGGTGAGKTTLMTSIIDAACLQGAEVILADGRAGKDLRRIAYEGRPGVVSYSAGSAASLHRSVLYVHDEYRRRQVLQERLQREGVEYQPTTLLFVFDEWGSFIHTLSKGTKEQKDAAQITVARMEQLAAESRELRINLLLAGQHSYVSAMTGTLRTNVKTLVVIGPPEDRHLEALFEGPKRAQARELGAQISTAMKGRGIVADTLDDGEGDLRISMFQGFYNATGSEAASAFGAALAATPKLRRFAWQFPAPDAAGGDGAWQDWTPVSDPSSDSLPTVYLDGPDGQPDPGATVYDPTSRDYSPGVRPLRAEHEHRESYDNKDGEK